MLFLLKGIGGTQQKPDSNSLMKACLPVGRVPSPLLFKACTAGDAQKRTGWRICHENLFSFTKHMGKKHSLIKLLQELDKEELIAEIEKICDKFDIVRDYFQIDLTGDTSAYVAQARKKIEGQFYTAAGKPRRPKASRLNKIIADFEILSIYIEDVIQLLLFRVEKTIRFITANGYYEPPLLQSTLRAFSKACTLITNNDLAEKYVSQCAAINTAGYGVYYNEELDTIFQDHFKGH